MGFDAEFDARLDALLNMKVRVTRVAELAERDSDVSTGYTVVGYLLELPTVGKPLELLRLERNGVKNVGHFLTSNVVTFMDSPKKDEWFFTTEHSFYMLEVCNDTQ